MKIKHKKLHKNKYLKYKMQKQYILNRKLNIAHKKEQDKLLLKKIKKAKSLIDIKCPESFTFFKTSFRDGLTKNTCIYIL